MKAFLKSSGQAAQRLSLGVYSRAEISDFLAGKADGNALSSKAEQFDLDVLSNTVNSNNANAVRVTGAQTIAGVKTFQSAPVVPDASFTISKISALQAALTSKLDANLRSVANGVAGLNAAGRVTNAAGAEILGIESFSTVGQNVSQANSKENGRRAIGIFTSPNGVFPTVADGAAVGDIFISV